MRCGFGGALGLRQHFAPRRSGRRRRRTGARSRRRSIWAMTDELWTCHLGTVEYREAADLQERLRERVIAGELPPLLLLLEHPAVYTLGRRSEPGDLPFGEDYWRAQGIDVVRTPRGGKLTYHGPGQLVGYPIMRARDIPAFMRTMEAALVDRAGRGGDQRARPRPRGAAVHRRLGRGPQDRVDRRARLARRDAHGFAVNVDNDVAPFHQVTACGLPGVRMTSVALETGRAGGLGVLPQARRLRLRAGPRAAPADRRARRGSGSRRSRVSAPRRCARHEGVARTPSGCAAAASCCASAATRSSAPSAAAASAASSPLEPRRTRSAGAAARTSATARSRCCWRAAARAARRRRERCCTSRPSGASASAPLPPGLRYVTADLDPRQGRPRSSTSARSTCPTRPSTRSSAATCSSTSTATRDALAELRRVRRRRAAGCC